MVGEKCLDLEVRNELVEDLKLRLRIDVSKKFEVGRKKSKK